MARHLYRPMLRPVASYTLPPDVRNSWEYVSRPASFTINRPDLPQSRYPYGEISLPRMLTLDESDRFGLDWFGTIDQEMVEPKYKDDTYSEPRVHWGDQL